MIRVRLACAIGAFLVCAALAPIPAIADSLQRCKDRTEALRNEQANDSDFAIEACTNFLATAQGDQRIQGYLYRAIAYFDKHDYYHAVKDFDKVISKNEVISKRAVQLAYIDQGLAYENQMADDPAFADRAISDLTEADKLEAGVEDKTKAQFWQAYLVRATTNLKKGEDDQALADEAEAIQLNPDTEVAIKAGFAQAYTQRGWQSLASGKYGQAVHDFQQAIQLDPTTADKLAAYLTEAQSRQPGPYSSIARGDQHAEDQSYTSALNDYAEAIRANPNLAEAYLHRGYVHEALDQFTDARADFDEAIRLNRNDWLGFYERGKLYQSMDQFDKATEDFDQTSAIVERVHDSAYQAEKERIANARKSVEFSSTIENHWISYLKEIQAAKTYPNWSGAPYDLYVEHHRLQNDVALQPEQADKRQQTGPRDRGRRPILAVVMVGIIVIIALFSAVLFRGLRSR
jgi:tetratricopeptide (TPR) repeat protein